MICWFKCCCNICRSSGGRPDCCEGGGCCNGWVGCGGCCIGCNWGAITGAPPAFCDDGPNICCGYWKTQSLHELSEYSWMWPLAVSRWYCERFAKYIRKLLSGKWAYWNGQLFDLADKLLAKSSMFRPL